MQTQINARQEKTIWKKLRQYSGLLLFSLMLTACSQDSGPQQSVAVASDVNLNAFFPTILAADTNLVVDVVVNGDTDNPLRVKNLSVDTTADTFSGDVSGIPTGTSTLSLVYSIIDPVQGTIEVIRTVDITINVVVDQETSIDFSSVEIAYITDTDGDTFSNLNELYTGTDINIPNYTVGGQVEKLTGSGLILQNNGSDDLTISENGMFSFSPTAIDGDEYAVSVLTQPDSPHQICTVNNASGTITDAPAFNVSVICKANTAPTATSVMIEDVNGGNTVAGNLLNGSYTYTDAENNIESKSTFRWLADGVAIARATTTRYVITASDIGKTITFEVTPVASTGITTGTATRSAGLKIVPGVPFFPHRIAINAAEGITMTGYTARALDADNDTVTFSLNGGADREAFSINSDSGVLSFTIATRFKTPADSDGNNIYEVEITATDGIHSTVRHVTVTVTRAILEVSVSTPGIKTIRFEWPAYVDATNYKLFVNPDGVSGYRLLQDNLSETSTTITLPVHLTDWINARYMLEAHDSSGKLAESSPVSITAVMIASIGYIKASNTGENDWFGGAVSLSADGNTLVVGAIGEDSIATGVSPGSNSRSEINNTADNSGAVYVFSLNEGIWEQQAYVKASNIGEGDRFGNTMSLSADGNTLAVGAIGEDSASGVQINAIGGVDNTTSNSGAVYVFSRSDGFWSQQAYVKASNAGEGDSFGYAVSLSADGNALAVGAIREGSAATGISTDGSGEADNAARGAGAVYVYSRDKDIWNQQAYVKASNTGVDDRFGIAVSLSANGNTLAVGAIREGSAATGVSTDGSGEADNTARESGAVYVYSFNDGIWNQQAYVKASNTGTNDWFGSAVSLSGDGNALAVGANGEDSVAAGVNTDGRDEDDNTASNSGAVYMFSRSDKVWNQQAYVKASNTRRFDSFGGAVSLSADGNTLAVGAREEKSADGSNQNDNTANRAGAVYVFSRYSGIWVQQTYVKANNTEKYDQFGNTVSLSGDGNTLAVGATGEDSAATGISTGGNISADDNSANNAGAVYLY